MKSSCFPGALEFFICSIACLLKCPFLSGGEKGQCETKDKSKCFFFLNTYHRFQKFEKFCWNNGHSLPRDFHRMICKLYLRHPKLLGFGDEARIDVMSWEHEKAWLVISLKSCLFRSYTLPQKKWPSLPTSALCQAILVHVREYPSQPNCEVLMLPKTIFTQRANMKYPEVNTGLYQSWIPGKESALANFLLADERIRPDTGLDCGEQIGNTC